MPRKKTQKEFIKEIFNLVGNEYTILGQYIHSNENIRIKHNVCNYEWDVKPRNFIYKGTRCPKCNGVAKKNTVIFKQEVYDLVGDEYTVLGEYINSKTLVRIRHNTCSMSGTLLLENLLIMVTDVLNVNIEVIKRPPKNLNKKCLKKTSGKYEIIGEYINAKTPILIKHNACGNNWLVTPDSFFK